MHRFSAQPEHTVLAVARRLHDVVLGQATVIGVHGITATGLQVSDVAQSQLPTTVLVALELGDGRISRLGSVEADDASASGAATWLVLDFRLLDVSNGAEELDQILVASRPWKLCSALVRASTKGIKRRCCSRCGRR